MVTVRQRRKLKSSTRKVTRRTKDKHRKAKNFGNAVIAENWDPKLTLAQNYERMGLQVKLGTAIGSTSKAKAKSTSKPEESAVAGVGKIIRDEEGNVVRVEYDEMEEEEEEDEDEDEESSKEPTEVVKKLEEIAASGITKPRVQSGREQDWIRRLVEKHGDNYEKMFWDKKLNIYQQSVGDLKRRVIKWKKANGLL